MSMAPNLAAHYANTDSSQFRPRYWNIYAGFWKVSLKSPEDPNRWRHLYELLTAGRNVYSELKNLCVWAKTNGGMGSLYRSRHELIAVYKHGSAPHINNVELGRFTWRYVRPIASLDKKNSPKSD